MNRDDEYYKQMVANDAYRRWLMLGNTQSITGYDYLHEGNIPVAPPAGINPQPSPAPSEEKSDVSDDLSMMPQPDEDTKVDQIHFPYDFGSPTGVQNFVQAYVPPHLQNNMASIIQYINAYQQQLDDYRRQVEQTIPEMNLPPQSPNRFEHGSLGSLRSRSGSLHGTGIIKGKCPRPIPSKLNK